MTPTANPATDEGQRKSRLLPRKEDYYENAIEDLHFGNSHVGHSGMFSAGASQFERHTRMDSKI